MQMEPFADAIRYTLGQHELTKKLTTEVAHTDDDNDIYVNFDFNVAVVVQVSVDHFISPTRLLFTVGMMEWAADHGLKNEVYVYEGHSWIEAMSGVKNFLVGYLEQQKKTQALIDSMPADL